MSKVYLIPNTIATGCFQSFNYIYYSEAIYDCKMFFVEHIKPARRLIKTLIKNFNLNNVEFIEWSKSEIEKQQILHKALKNQENIGVISDAGLPGIADPGQDIVRISHQYRAKICPLIGPSAIFLALMASGCQGQRFSFHGYLPIEKFICIKRIKEIVQDSQNQQAAQIFIETPHRNNSLLQLLLENLPKETLLCIAIDIGSPTESIITQNVHSWKKQIPTLPKKPCTFILYLE